MAAGQVYWSGIGAKVTFQPTNGAVMQIDNQTWNKSKKNKVIEMTNANTLNNEIYISGVFAQSGDFDVCWDSTNTPEAGGLIEGNTGVITEYLGLSGQGYSQKVIIEEIAPKTATAEGIKYNAKYKGNGPITKF